MEKVTKSSVGTGSYEGGHLLPEGGMDQLVGKLCTLIEATGMTTTQEKSVKDLIKQTVRTQFSRDYGCYWIPDELNYVVVNMMAELHNRWQTTAIGENTSVDFELTLIPR